MDKHGYRSTEVEAQCCTGAPPQLFAGSSYVYHQAAAWWTWSPHNPVSYVSGRSWEAKVEKKGMTLLLPLLVYLIVISLQHIHQTPYLKLAYVNNNHYFSLRIKRVRYDSKNQNPASSALWLFYPYTFQSLKSYRYWAACPAVDQYRQANRDLCSSGHPNLLTGSWGEKD